MCVVPGLRNNACRRKGGSSLGGLKRELRMGTSCARRPRCSASAYGPYQQSRIPAQQIRAIGPLLRLIAPAISHRLSIGKTPSILRRAHDTVLLCPYHRSKSALTGRAALKGGLRPRRGIVHLLFLLARAGFSSRGMLMILLLCDEFKTPWCRVAQSLRFQVPLPQIGKRLSCVTEPCVLGSPTTTRVSPSS